MRLITKVFTVVISIFLLDAAICVVYAGYFDRGPSREKESSYKGASLKNAEQAFVKGDYEEVIRIGGAYRSISNKKDGRLHHILGRAFLKLGRYDEARNRFSIVVNHSDDEELLDDAYIGLADSYMLEGDCAKAVDYYEKILRYFPDSNYLPIVYYRLGESYTKLGNEDKASDSFNKLIKMYPYSLETGLLGEESYAFVAYSVQVASFSKWKNAKNLSEELRGKGFDANIHTAILGDKRFYRVRVGQYASMADAEDLARKLKNAGYDVKICP